MITDERPLRVIDEMSIENKACDEIIRILARAHLSLDRGLDTLSMVIVTVMSSMKMPPEEAHHVADEMARSIKNNYHLNVERLQ